MQRATIQVGVGSATPWGAAQYADALGGAGVAAVSTASHGGLYVPHELLPLISDEGRAYAQKYTQSEHWYEEDCGWAYVAEAFPELFTPAKREDARMTLAWMHRDEIAVAMAGLDGGAMGPDADAALAALADPQVQGVQAAALGVEAVSVRTPAEQPRLLGGGSLPLDTLPMFGGAK